MFCRWQKRLPYQPWINYTRELFISKGKKSTLCIPRCYHYFPLGCCQGVQGLYGQRPVRVSLYRSGLSRKLNRVPLVTNFNSTVQCCEYYYIILHMLVVCLYCKNAQ